MSGLGTATNVRRHFSGVVGVSPAEYRRTFRQRESVPARWANSPSLGKRSQTEAGYMNT
ncbi:hypothetical protein [Nocardia sp. NPDC004750]